MCIFKLLMNPGIGSPESNESRSKKGPRLSAVVAAFLLCPVTGAFAETPEQAAHEILMDMSEYLGQVQNLSLDFSSDVEVISHGGQTNLSGLKVQFSSSGNVVISRPGKIRARRTGGFSDVEIISDSQTLTISGRNVNAYAQTGAAPTLDELFEAIRSLTGAEFPGSDLLFSDVYGQLSDPIEDAAYIGTAMIDGTECHHLAFSTLDVYWQIWIDTGDKPIPRKYIITSKWITGAPQYQLRISNWNDNPALTANLFNFLPSAGAKTVSIEELEGIGDLPIPAIKGGQ